MQHEPGRTHAARRRSCRLVLWLISIVVAGLASPAEAAEIQEASSELSGGTLQVSLLLEGAFSADIEERLEAGLEVGFEYQVRLRRRRRRFIDKTVSERRVMVTAQFSNLTRMYKLTRQIDATVVATDLTDRREDMRHWMTQLEALEMFGGRDLERPGEYYVSARVKLLRRFRLLFLPADVQTEWRETESIVLPDAAEQR